MTLAEELRKMAEVGDYDAELLRRTAAKVERLQAALKKYGCHSPGCAIYEREILPCDCGWGDIEKTL